ncbi:hypothetical protein VHUM_00957 [Vanrija humicola]|uniref:DUF3752 domain-containing protein n=1 Tax=Vanrija humicola TaxID=5417 RepID=A0A7D8Z3H1_VANHU|nr:hypothetical protein VHUM_00957 [Vanrija humicola]
MPIGPQLPPHLAGANRAATPSDDEDDGDFGPALPPELAAKRKLGPQRPPTSDDEDAIGPSVGPARPPGPSLPGPSLPGPSRPPPGPARPPAPADSDSDSDDDYVGPRLDDIGPTPVRSAADEFRERERQRWEREKAKAEGPKVTQREEWMLVPPSSGSLSSLDPTKRPTSFNRTSKAAITPEDQTVWTETPAQKAQRLADEMAGIKRKKDVRPDADEEDAVERKRRRERDREIRRGVEQHNTSTRGASLLEQHQKKKAASKDEDDFQPIWDREKHMGVTGRLLTDQERSQKIRDARGLNDRFGHGKGGAYAQ